MIINNNLYYTECPYVRKYVQLENAIQDFLAMFTVKYVYEGSVVTKTSDIFPYGDKTRVYFQYTGRSVTIDVFRHTGGQPIPLFHIALLKSKTTCFRLSGTEINPRCTEVPC